MGVNAKDKTKGVLSFSSGTPKYDRETERQRDGQREPDRERQRHTDRERHTQRERESVCVSEYFRPWRWRENNGRLKEKRTSKQRLLTSRAC